MAMIPEQIVEQCRAVIAEADAILVGAGSGFSAAAGLLYSGKRFTDNFADYIERYHLTDMYSAAFYPFPSLEEKWGYFSRHIKLNRYDAPVGDVYIQLMQMVEDREHFIITTNVDAQFFKAGFDPKRIFATQGDYGKFQCITPCHGKLYDNEKAITLMVEQQVDCRIPSALLPKCPKCGGRMVAHLRIDDTFVENDEWYEAEQSYASFIRRLEDKKLVLLELGVGFNTPVIIRWPFEKMTSVRENTTLIRVNYDGLENRFDIDDQSILIKGDIAKFFSVLS